MSIQAQHEAARYNRVAIFLHWLTLVVLLLQFYTGWTFGDMERGAARTSWFEWHRTLGFVVLFLSIARLAWRLLCPPPAFPSSLPQWERVVARINHGLFYFLLIALPLTGWVYVSSGNTAATTGVTTLVGGVSWPIIPGLPRSAHRLSADIHVVLVYITCFLILLHLAAVLKHQFIDKNRMLNRMLPSRSQKSL